MWTFILIALLCFVIYCVYGFCAAFGESGSVVGAILSLLILLGAGHAWLCSHVWWYGEKVEAPEIVINFKDGFLSETNPEPLLGEEIIKDSDGNYYVTLTDHRINYSDDYDKTPDLEITISPKNATLEKGNPTLTITKLAANKSSSHHYDNSDLKDQATTLDKKFSFMIDGGDLRYNENADVEPTKYRLTAKNKRGETSVFLTINRYPLYKACELYDTNHPDRNAVNDVPLCKKRADDYEKKNTSSSGQNNSTHGSFDYLFDNNSGGTGSTCIHYEAGRCWDELEDQAYDDGYWDKNYGYHGAGYNPPDDCTGTCLDIYDDAYYEGYDDY